MAKYSDIKKHSETVKHKLKVNPHIDNKQQRIASQTVSETVTKPSCTVEGMLIMATSEHGSILAINHIGHVVKKAFNDSKAASDFK